MIEEARLSGNPLAKLVIQTKKRKRSRPCIHMYATGVNHVIKSPFAEMQFMTALLDS